MCEKLSRVKNYNNNNNNNNNNNINDEKIDDSAPGLPSERWHREIEYLEKRRVKEQTCTKHNWIRKMIDWILIILLKGMCTSENLSQRMRRKKTPQKTQWFWDKNGSPIPGQKTRPSAIKKKEGN